MRVVLKKDLKIDNMLFHKHSEFFLIGVSWNDKDRDSFNYTLKYKDKILVAEGRLFDFDCRDVRPVKE